MAVMSQPFITLTQSSKHKSVERTHTINKEKYGLKKDIKQQGREIQLSGRHLPSRNAAHRFILWAKQNGHISLGSYRVKEADINVLQQWSSELTLTTTLNKEMGSGTDSHTGGGPSSAL